MYESLFRMIWVQVRVDGGKRETVTAQAKTPKKHFYVRVSKRIKIAIKRR